MMQNCQSEYDVETLVGKFQIVGVHLSKITGELVSSGGRPSDLELRFRNIDAGSLRRPVAVCAQARFPFLGTKLEYLLARCLDHCCAYHFPAPLTTDALIHIG